MKRKSLHGVLLQHPSAALYLILSLRDSSALPIAQVLVWWCRDPLSADSPVVLSPVPGAIFPQYPETQVASRSCTTRAWACFRLTVPHHVPCSYSLLGFHESPWCSWNWPVTGRRAQLPVAPETTLGARRSLSFSLSARPAPVPPHYQELLARTCVVRCVSFALSPVHAILGPSGYSGPWHSCALLRFCGAWWLRRRQPTVLSEPSEEPYSCRSCCSISSFLSLPTGLRPGLLPSLSPGRCSGNFLAVTGALFILSGWERNSQLVRPSSGTGSVIGWSGGLVLWLPPGWNTMPPKRDHRAQPWTEE